MPEVQPVSCTRRRTWSLNHQQLSSGCGDAAHKNLEARGLAGLRGATA